MRRTLQIPLDAQHGAEQPEFAQPLAALVGVHPLTAAVLR
jgi:hypothetical protein